METDFLWRFGLISACCVANLASFTARWVIFWELAVWTAIRETWLQWETFFLAGVMLAGFHYLAGLGIWIWDCSQKLGRLMG